MNAQAKIQPATLAKLREPFPANQISKLPKETKKQADDRKADMAQGKWPQKCSICEGFHHPKAVHLDYVGHAALTDRLLDTDLEWDWEPLGYDERGLPAFDSNGGLWIKLTVLGKSRIGYGSADGKSGGDAKKEIIGDALRNAAMRFGAALDLWHKGDLHADESADDAAPNEQQRAKIDDSQWATLVQMIEAKGADTEAFCKWLGVDSLRDIPACDFFKAKEGLNKKPDKPAPNPQRDEVLADEIPY
jgi:hypothetical protein